MNQSRHLSMKPTKNLPCYDRQRAQRILMKVAGLLLVLLVSGPFVEAATCKKVVSPGFIPFDPFTVVFHQPDVLIVVRSKGHSVEYVYDFPDVLVSVDGNAPERIDAGSALDAIQSACGPDFSLQARHADALQSHASSPPSPAGQTSEDFVFADFNGDGIPDSAALY